MSGIFRIGQFSRLSAAYAISDAAERERTRVEQSVEFFTRKRRFLRRNVSNAPSLGIGLFGNLGGFLITDEWVERGDQDGIFLHQRRYLRTVHAKTAYGFIRQKVVQELKYRWTARYMRGNF